MKVRLRLFLVRFHGSKENGAEMGRSCGRTLGHGDSYGGNKFRLEI